MHCEHIRQSPTAVRPVPSFLPSFPPSSVPLSRKAVPFPARLLPFGVRGPCVRECSLIGVQRRGRIPDAPRRQEAEDGNTVETTVPPRAVRPTDRAIWQATFCGTTGRKESQP